MVYGDMGLSGCIGWWTEMCRGTTETIDLEYRQTYEGELSLKVESHDDD